VCSCLAGLASQYVLKSLPTIFPLFAGMPTGPELHEPSQAAEGQPGLQAKMQHQPITDKLPTQHGHQNLLTLETYWGVGKLKGKVRRGVGGGGGRGLCFKGGYVAAACSHPSMYTQSPKPHRNDAMHPQVALITGGDSGIGRSVAVMMAKEKCRTIAIVHHPKERQVGWPSPIPCLPRAHLHTPARTLPRAAPRMSTAQLMRVRYDHDFLT
jgi:hypothetical protein